ncbi:hypothetical protein DOS84_00960 [Flavobacterium aquariorum]|uniref:Uncharacterized protein n=1 Tax=Flavobacterium aquariorum TaxID=2217670 RepID=A0A2W7UCA3_9FLAO|nr:hypothetical protein [Flavobacterium aquariorum]PZX95169.1 hypothetical protein DOS84_00960 [Flavobacterium aquariorum]
MPIENLGKIHFSKQQIQDINKALTTLTDTLAGMSVNLTAAEHQKYGRVKEKNKLLIDKVKNYHDNQPRLQSPEVDWKEFDLDYENRLQASQMLLKIKAIESQLINIKILGDYDNYTDALRDYQYAKYKNRFANESGYSKKIEDMIVFFPRTGITKKEV